MHKSWEVLAAGSPTEIDAHPAAAGAQLRDHTGSVLMPATVNAHTHLDLTALGPKPIDREQGFAGWVLDSLKGRPTEPDAIARSVRTGVDSCLAAGVAAVGDIGGSSGGRIRTEALAALRQSPLRGVHFPEFFGIGGLEPAARAQLRAFEADLPEPAGAVRLGLSPHATSSVSSGLFLEAVELAARQGLPICAHAAEHPAEREFVASATGQMRAFAEKLGFWDSSIEGDLGRGLRPIQHCRPWLERAAELGVPVLMAHALDADDVDIELLAKTGAHVVYCPRSTRYFGNELTLGPHRWRDMLAAGVNVCLGTDSVVNLGRDPALPGGRCSLSVLDEARVLARTESADVRTLADMLTVRGARALGLDERQFGLRPGDRPLGVLAVATAVGSEGGEPDPFEPDPFKPSPFSGDSEPVWVA